MMIWLSWLNSLFYIDRISLIMMTLIFFISFIIVGFSFSYLKGDRRRKRFFFLLTGLSLSLTTLVGADNFWLFLFSWSLSNTFLIFLMIHKSDWRQARESGFLAAKYLILGSVFLALALVGLLIKTGKNSIHELNQAKMLVDGFYLLPMLMAMLMQSAIFPFHRWLISSLNSPTPVSAIMHAGLINGGGFLALRFSPLLLESPHFLTSIYMFGCIAALLGSLWKLMQHDIKRMLACSTLAQMGFMLMQCGLGLFPAALAHLCWHGLFKAYLFLGFVQVAKEKRLKNHYPPRFLCFILACICGFLGAVSFALTSGLFSSTINSHWILIGIVFIAATQFSLAAMEYPSTSRFFMILTLTTGVTALYGGSIHLFERILAPLDLTRQLPLSHLYVMGFLFLFTAWLSMLFFNKKLPRQSDWVKRGYVMALNASQPHPGTVTAYRTHYRC